MRSMLYSYIFLLAVLSTSQARCLITIDKDLEAQKGFHRKLKFVVTFDEADHYNNIDHVLLQYEVSPDIYIDSDEVNNQLNQLFAFSSHIDTELPAYQSIRHSISINLTDFVSVATVEFPFHMRYRKPSTVYYQRVTIPTGITLHQHNTDDCVTIPTEYTALVPCGVIHHSYLVILGSVIVTAIGSIVITYSIISQ